MNYQSKTKAELIKELQELQGENNFLKLKVETDHLEYKQAVASLQEREEQFRAILETIPLAIYFSTGTEQICEYINPRFTDLFGYTLEDIPKVENWWPLAFPDENYRLQVADQWTKRARLSLETKTNIEPMEVVVSCKDGSKKNIQWGYMTLGEKSCAFGLDITKSKQVEDTLSLKNIAFDASIAANSIADINGILTDVNDSFLRIWGYPDKLEVIGNPLTIFINDPSVLPTIITTLNNTGEWDGDFTARKKDGSTFEAHGLATLVKDATGKQIGYQSSVLDITGTKLAKEALEVSELRFRNILQDVKTVAVQGYAPDGTTTYWNKASELLYGFTAQEAIGSNLLDLIIPSEMRDNVSEAIKWMADTGISIPSSELVLQRKNGSYVSVYSHHTIVQVPGRPQELFCIDIDLTDLKLSEEKLKVSEQLYRNLFEQANEGLILLTLDGKIAELNQSFAQMHGYTIAEMKNMDIKDLDVLRENAFEGRAELMQRIYDGEVVRFEVEHFHKNGHSFFLSDTVSLITIAGQSYFLAFHQDITERKETENALQKERLLLRSIIDNIPDTIYTKDLSCRKTLVNLTDMQFIGVENESEIIGKDDFDLYPKEIAEKFYADDQSVLSTGLPLLNREEFFIDRNQKKRWLLTSKIPLVGIDNQIIGLLGIGRDITEIELSKIELTKAKEKAEESDNLKSSFLANMSHEIRTPMNGILGFAELLKEPKLTGEEKVEYIEIIEKSGKRMLNIINDVVDISKIESGQMSLNLGESDINEQLEYIYTFFKPEVEAKGLHLIVLNSLPSNEAIINTDREKVFAIFTNLVKNAIKFSDNGNIEIGYTLITVSDSYELEFFVKDQGIGIPNDRQTAIFERFIQADIGDRRAYQGAGLGLAITKSYVEMLGGRIWVVSEESRGSTFYFTLPYNRNLNEKDCSELIVPATDTINKISSLKILIAEDDKDSAKIIEIKMRKHCRNLIIVPTAKEAIETCRNNPDIDLIFMDIKMPGINGYEATRQIRQFNPDVVIIAQTAFALSGDREKAIEAGCNDYISKPINTVALKVLLQKYFNN